MIYDQLMSVLKILGIDPGLNNTGWSILQSINNKISLIDYGVIKNKVSIPLPQKLANTYTELSKIISSYNPNNASLEEIFINKNPQSSIKLSQARGVILLSLELNKTPIYEYKPNLVKKTITGSGHADKQQISIMLKSIFNNLDTDVPDITDSIAIALCHFYNIPLLNKIKK